MGPKTSRKWGEHKGAKTLFIGVIYNPILVFRGQPYKNHENNIRRRIHQSCTLPSTFSGECTETLTSKPDNSSADGCFF